MVAPVHLEVKDEKNVFSQSGEDGIIARCIELLSISQPGVCVEIGAWDGEYLSNTAVLRRSGWKTCLIEQDQERFYQLVQNCAGSTCIHQKVELVLDGILEAHFPYDDIDVLSIDIDGDDIWVFRNLMVRPRIVVIEYNPTFPPFLCRENPVGTNKGSSLRALELVGIQKGYELVYATISNAIFVDGKRNGVIAVKDVFAAFRWDDVRFVASDFDGTNYFADMYQIRNSVVNAWSKEVAAHLGPKNDQNICRELSTETQYNGS